MFALVLAALVHHAVSTQVPAAQEAFDEGLTLVYAFNRDEAQRRFTAAANADPNLALAWWGVALAAGPNLNFDMTKKDWTTVQQALGKAVLLQSRASPEEQRLIAALQKRYPQKAQEPDGAAYRDAMAAIHRDFPSDDDVAALYVESAMDVDEWGWKPDGSPVGKTSELAATLRGVIARSPAHPGANHYFTHLMDFQSVAEQAEPSANLLASLPVQPAASHLKHMSGHIYLDVGSFVPLLVQNREAVEMDRSYAASIGTTPQKLDYYLHNLDFYAGGALMLDDRAEAERAAGFFNEAESRGSMFVYAR